MLPWRPVRNPRKQYPKYLTLVKLDERVRRPSQRSNVLLKIIRIIYLTYMCVTCVNHVTHSSNVLDQILVRRLWRCKNIWALPLSLFCQPMLYYLLVNVLLKKHCFFNNNHYFCNSITNDNNLIEYVTRKNNRKIKTL